MAGAHRARDAICTWGALALLLVGGCGGPAVADREARSDRSAGDERTPSAATSAASTGPRRMYPAGCADAVAFDNGDLVAGERTRLLRFEAEAGQPIRALARFTPAAEVTLALRGPEQGSSRSTVMHLPRVRVMGGSPGTDHDVLHMTAREPGYYVLEAELRDGIVRWQACVFVDR